MRNTKRISLVSAGPASEVASTDVVPILFVSAKFAGPLILVLVAGLVGGVGQGLVALGTLGISDATGAFSVLDWSRVSLIALDACETAVVEEVLFRGVLLWACLQLARRVQSGRPVLWAMAISSLIFGLFHLLPAGELAAAHADIAVVVVQGALKVAQAAAFGALMALLVVCGLRHGAAPHVDSRITSRADQGAVSGCPFIEVPPSAPLAVWAWALIASIVVHAVFDFLYLGPLLLVTGQLPATYLSGRPADLVPLAASTVLLVVALSLACAKSVRAADGE